MLIIQVIHQAVAVWVGDKRPDAVPKKVVDEEYKKRLEEHREKAKILNVREVSTNCLFVLYLYISICSIFINGTETTTSSFMKLTKNKSNAFPAVEPHSCST